MPQLSPIFWLFLSLFFYLMFIFLYSSLYWVPHTCGEFETVFFKVNYFHKNFKW